ncbi:MAG TPA: DUF1285 domain-containing protein [Chakrabartia sp.]|jgi:hypothetical protein|nr:DUF1285 domain-containing protein [Chakrabartia sp.]
MAHDPLPANLAHLSLDAVMAAAAAQRLPPVHAWHPPHRGHSAMEIRRDGSWWHEGGKIERAALVRLFASILRREEDGRFVLVTPVEMMDIDVEDTPFLAVELKAEAGQLAFRTNTGEAVVAGPDHPIRVEDRDGEPHPVILVRDGLEARIERAPFYELAEMALSNGSSPPGVWSSGVFFPLMDAA